MNRRRFLTDILKLGVACAILPSALTYKRQWKTTPGGLIVPHNVYYNGTTYECALVEFTTFWKNHITFVDHDMKRVIRLNI